MNNHSQIPILSIALFEPRIPQNTGNIARTCAAFNLPLHLIEPLGFSLESKLLKRAGLDYWPYINIKVHSDFNTFLKKISKSQRLIGFSKSSNEDLSTINFKKGDVLLLGREDLGLPDFVRGQCFSIASIPMPGGVNDNKGLGVRSLNLSSATAIVAYQAGLKLGLFN